MLVKRRTSNDRPLLGGPGTQQWAEIRHQNPLAQYGVGVASGRPVIPVAVDGLSDADGFQIGRHPTGRIWVVQRGPVAADLLGRSRCGPDWHDELFTVACLARP